MHYTDFPDAPQAGAVICASSDVSEGGYINANIGAFEMLVFGGETPHVYVNACPHQFLPLDHNGTAILGEDGKTILCTNHSAVFDKETGIGTEGMAVGCNLVKVPVSIQGDNIIVGE